MNSSLYFRTARGPDRGIEDTPYWLGGSVYKSGARTVVAWKAAFVEDADELHLAVKPMYAALIKVWCGNDHVRAEFIRTAPGSTARLAKLLAEVEGVLEAHAKRFA